ncbi:hypothetical protein AWB71_02568 [Caballeronia peredens]|nr:hypothetical protein AWB71_02568 [Caballeronia peredens]
MNVLITPDATEELKRLVREDPTAAGRAFGVIQRFYKEAMQGRTPSSELVKMPKTGESVWVVKGPKVNVFYAMVDDKLIILGVTSKPSMFDFKSRLEDYLRGKSATDVKKDEGSES